MKLSSVLFVLLASVLCSCFLGLVVFLSEIIYKIEPETEQVYVYGTQANEQSLMPPLAETESKNIVLSEYSGDIQKGERVFRQCLLCHNVQKDGGNKIGPNLYSVYQRAPASLENFPYSTAMKNFAKTHKRWDKDTLDAFLEAPKKLVVGTNMAFFGLRKAQDRLDLIRYLESLPQKD